MEHKKDIMKMAKKIFRHQKKITNAKLVHPERDWLLGLLAAAVFLAANGFWSYYTYNSYRNPDLSEDTGGGGNGLVTYHASKVEAVLRDFSEREKEHQELLKNLSVNTVSSSDLEPKPGKDILGEGNSGVATGTVTVEPDVKEASTTDKTDIVPDLIN